MDLVNGSKEVIIMMTHFNKHGESKLLPECELPLTGVSVVSTVVTDKGVFKPTGNSFDIIKLAEGVSKEELNLP